MSAQVQVARIYADKIKNYVNDTRPVDNRAKITEVSFGFRLMKVIGTNTAKGWLQVSAYVEISWIDEKLIWNRDLYDDVGHLFVDLNKIWSPIIISERIIDLEHADQNNQVHVHCTGKVTQIRTYNIKSLCNFEVSQYPYDKEKCEIIWISHIYDDTEVRLKIIEQIENIHDYDSEEWSVQKMTQEKTQRSWVYNNRTYNWDQLIFTVYLNRKGMYYWLTLMLPTIIITLLCTFGLFLTSTVRHVRKEKISIGLTALLAVTFFLTILNDVIPRTESQFPIIGWFIIIQIFLLLFMSFVATLILMMRSLQLFDINPPAILLKIYRVNENKISPWSKKNSKKLKVKKEGIWNYFMSQVCAITKSIGLHFDNIKINETDTWKWDLLCYRIDLSMLIIFVTINIIVFIFFSTNF